MQSGTELRGKSSSLIGQQQTNLSNWSSGVQIARDICTRFGRYLYSTKYSRIIKHNSFFFSCTKRAPAREIISHGKYLARLMSG